jgi:signal transduction histidine kinase
MKDPGPPDSRVRESREFRDLSLSILELANQGRTRSSFLHEATRLFLRFVACDGLEMWVKSAARECRWRSWRSHDGIVHFKTLVVPDTGSETRLLRTMRDLLEGRLEPPLENTCPHGSFFTGELDRLFPHEAGDSSPATHGPSGRIRSLACLPFRVGTDGRGLLSLEWGRNNAFTPVQVEIFESLAGLLGIALVNHRTQSSLEEKIRELTCISGIARVVAREDLTLSETLEATVRLLPSAWRKEQAAEARILLDDEIHSTDGFRPSPDAQRRDLVVRGEVRGVVEVMHRKPAPEDCFLEDRTPLLQTVAQELSAVVEMKLAERDRASLREQLRHADRLATIGQLSAGVAHELNEPLGSVVGFSELCLQQADLVPQARRDLEKIFAAAMHAREVIRKLMFFARERPPTRDQVCLNQIIEEGLDFLDSRARTSNIELVRKLDPALPEISADPNQLHQVLINLVVNAMQAMPDGGRLTIETYPADGQVVLVVEDRGLGMSPQVMGQIFVPFFTTKAEEKGTGLGLSVVHGIVTSHGGTVHVDSQEGRGSRFEISLPLGPSGASRDEGSS